MKKERDYTIHLLLGIFLFSALVSYPGCYSSTSVSEQNLERHLGSDTSKFMIAGDGTVYPLYDSSYKTNNPSPMYETDGHTFYNGEILYPDYVHLDTLIVTDALYLNDKIHGPDVASDGDIMELLNETTKPYKPQ